MTDDNTCPICRGKGYTYEGYRGRFVEGRHVRCPTCKGLGYLGLSETPMLPEATE